MVFLTKICLGTTSNDDSGEETQQFTTIVDQDKTMLSSTTEQNALLSDSLEDFNNDTFCSDVDVDYNVILSWSTLVVNC